MKAKRRVVVNQQGQIKAYISTKGFLVFETYDAYELEPVTVLISPENIAPFINKICEIALTDQTCIVTYEAKSNE